MKSLITKMKLFAIGIAVVALAPAISFADSIDPLTYADTLAVGESVTITKTVTITEGAPTSALMDVMFLMDTTGSMGGVISAAKASAATILSDLAGFGDLASGAAYFNDDSCFGGCGAGTPLSTYTGIYAPLSTSDAATTAGINSYVAGVPGSGFDGPEEGYLGIYNTVTETTWRPGSNRFVVMFGDNNDGGDTPFAGDSQAEAAAALAAEGVTLIAVSYGSLFATEYTGTAVGSGGSMNTGSTSAAALADLIKDAVTASFSTYSSVCLDASGAPGGVGVGLSPSCIIGDFDRSIDREFDFDVTFTGVTPGVYTDFPITALVDGGIVATELDTITVTGAAGVPEPGILGLLGLGLLVLGMRRRKIAAA